MIDEKVNIIISEIRDELKSLYPDFRGIYLFGSHARGEANDDSDIDLAILFDREIEWRFKDEISNFIWLKMINNIIPIESFTLNYNDIFYPKTPFRENILTEGMFYGTQ